MSELHRAQPCNLLSFLPYFYVQKLFAIDYKAEEHMKRIDKTLG